MMQKDQFKSVSGISPDPWVKPKPQSSHRKGLRQGFWALTAVSTAILGGTAADAQDLQSFAIISGQSLTNTGPTTITGNIAVSPGTSYTGENTVTQDGAIFLGDAVSVRIQNDLTTLYTFLASRPTSTGGDKTGQGLAGMTLQPGVYNFDSTAELATNGVLTFDAGGNPDAVFIINIGSGLTIGNGTRVDLIGGAQGGNVFYRVGSSATIGTSADMEGQIVALTSITMNTTAQITCGAAFARNGSVTLDTNTISICTLSTPDITDVATDPTIPPSQQAVALALADFVNAGGLLPIGLAIIAATQTPDELAVSLAQLSGEVATGVAPMGLQMMDDFLKTITSRGEKPILQTIAPRDEGVPPGMVLDKVNAPYLGGKGTAAPVDTPQPMAFSTMLAEQAQPFNVWASVYGSKNVTDGDTGLGVRERTTDTSGVAVGLNYALGSGTDVGLALGWATADFTLDDASSTGASDAIFTAVRARSSGVNGYLAGALAYGRHDLTTDRSVTIAGFDRLRGETQANHVAAQVEAGYHLGLFTPFAGLRAQSFKTDAYVETATAGVDTYALRYDAQTTNSLRSELGVAVDWAADPTHRHGASFGLRAAWAHEFASNDAVSGTLATTPGLGFPATGASQDRDSLLLSANIGTSAANGVFVQGGINGAYASNTRDYGGSLTVGYRW